MKIARILVLACLVLAACSTEDDGGGTSGGGGSEVTFDRGAMLANWADNIILPAYANFDAETQKLEELTQAFVANPGDAEMTALKAQFRSSYLAFQSVSMFDIGVAEQMNFRSFVNTYPLDADAVDAKISSGNYDLNLPSSYDEQGFPAMDYLLYGLGSSKDENLAKFASGDNAENYKAYLLDVAERINMLAAEVTASWQGDYRDEFVENISSSSNGSVDRLSNKYVMYFEKYLRSGKIGFPSGAITGTPSPINVEAYYAQDLSKELYLQALESSEDFFTGKYFGNSGSGKSFQSYLEALDREDLADDILSQFDAISTKSAQLDGSLKNQVETNNTLMLETHDELQKEVVLLKLDMLQALSISVDYVDSDGD